MSDFTGYRGDWRFADWENEVLTVSTRPASGHTPTSLATNVRAKADGEKKGMEVSEMGTVTVANERRFFFAGSYTNASGSKLDPCSDGGNDLLAEGNILTDASSRTWTIISTPDPGGAGEHYEVQTTRRPT